MRIFTSITRNRGSRYRWSFGRRGKVRSRIRDYILKKLGIDDNFGGDEAYSVVDNLDKQFLRDTDLGAGLSLCLYEVSSAVGTLSRIGASGRMDVAKYLREKEQEAIKEATEFFGDSREDYKLQLEEMLSQWKAQQSASQGG